MAPRITIFHHGRLALYAPMSDALLYMAGADRTPLVMTSPLTVTTPGAGAWVLSTALVNSIGVGIPRLAPPAGLSKLAWSLKDLLEVVPVTTAREGCRSNHRRVL